MSHENGDITFLRLGGHLGLVVDPNTAAMLKRSDPAFVCTPMDNDVHVWVDSPDWEEGLLAMQQCLEKYSAVFEALAKT